ncbi:AAA family ATPase [Desulfobacula phenolica]|uniref:Lon protease (S16) C-terminal proteolytic domain-containing protein n=1 Tax=Desulfobacula phenolica TaxID=90732 RepID=A0A1H2IZW2_9BACT|nr:AAA family ATPase [Desulfobacula phenolica]SDU49511.1 Lon protease (S16) C-terminal proteolytic domain-containing protein [Desulfobacula phenolica]
MAKRTTKEKTLIRLPEDSIKKIENLVASWNYDTKAFVRSRLNQYKPTHPLISFLKEYFFLVFLMKRKKRKMNVLNNPEILRDWKKRFLYSGETNPGASWNTIIEKELTKPEYHYLIAVLDKELTDLHVPFELEKTFDKIYRAHIRKEHIEDQDVPKAPIVLIEGTSGSGKSATVRETLEKVVFRNEVIPMVDWKKKKEEILATHSLFTSLEDVDPEFAMKIARKRKQVFYSRLAQIPILRRIFKKRIMSNLTYFEERGMTVDSSIITPNDYQTALSGEPGNYFKRAMGHPKTTSIRHIEEAHSAFGKSESGPGSGGAEKQQRTLIDTSNIVLDEIIEGRRDCFVIATSDQTHRFDSAIYRRFVEKGCIIDISKYWMNAENLKKIIFLEIKRHQIPTLYHQDSESLDAAAKKIYAVFKERSLKISPAYVRKLIESIINIRGDFILDFLDNSILVRNAFQLVAKNVYGELYSKVVDRMDRTVKWDEYVGDIKDKFSEMANNCFSYGISEDKGVVLTGPPGSGKTFLVRTWLSSNLKVHDIATSPSALQDPSSPVHGAVSNLEKVYDIAKMVAPTIIFFDEGDALAPRRSATGGQPSDALTNKFLNIIDGEIPLNKVFTVLTTNRLDILDPALIRSKRLKTLEISGHMRQKDIFDIIKKQFESASHTREFEIEKIIETAQGICNTPADYTSFTEKAIALCSTEYKVLLKLRRLKESTREEKYNFIKLNFKTIIGILDAVKAPPLIKSKIKHDIKNFVAHYDQILANVDHIRSEKDYPLVEAHLESARREISQSPVRKGSIQLNEFLETELSKEPQVGFIIGVGANDLTGMLLPIATSLTGRVDGSQIIVTGAVSSSSANSAELDMAVQMTKQSAQEALTMVKNYIQELSPKHSIPWVFGDFLQRYSIHHQLLSASYNVGGPSAGYALALNTLSALLRIPLCIDFGITGAPWTKGVRKDEVGGSVIIGGHRKKTEKVLLYLRRMYMPLQNYKDLEPEFLMGYWQSKKDIIAVTHFADLMPEVFFLDDEHNRQLEDLIEMRIKLKSEKYYATKRTPNLKENIIQTKQEMRKRAENEILKRVDAIRKYLTDPDREKYISHDQIFKNYMEE